MPTARPALLLLASLVLVAGPADAFVTVLHVSDPLREYSAGDYRGKLAEALKFMPPEKAEAMRRALEAMPPPSTTPPQSVAGIDATHYEIVLENTSIDRFVRRLRLDVRYLDARGAPLGGESREVDVQLRPKSPEQVVYVCPDQACLKAAALQVVAVTPLSVSVYRDRWIRFADRTWHVVDDWQTERRVSILPFSPGHYDRTPFKDQVLEPRSFLIVDDEERVFKLLKPMPFSKSHPENDIRWMMGAGRIFKDGEPVKQGFFGNLFSANRIISGEESVELPAGEFVRIKHTEISGDDFGMQLRPVCDLSPGRRRLESWLYVRLGKSIFTFEDTERAEPALRKVIVPVALGEVARLCGPVSGTPILHLTAKSVERDVVAVMGKPEARREEAGAVELVYGEMRLRFVGGAFDGARFGS